MIDRRRRATGRRTTWAFIMFPKEMLQSSQFNSLSGRACKVLFFWRGSTTVTIMATCVPLTRLRSATDSPRAVICEPA